MRGVITSYRRGRHTQNENQIIVEVDGIRRRKDAAQLMGKKVYHNGHLLGTIHALHGNKGRVRVLLQRHIPGQMLGAMVEIR